MNRKFERVRNLLVFLVILTVAGCSKDYTDVEYIERAKNAQEKGDLTETIIELKNAILENPVNAEARWLLGNVYLEISSGEAAEKEFIKAQENGWNSTEIQIPLIKALLLQYNFDDALNHVSKANFDDENIFPTISALKGQAYLGLGQLEDAKEAFEYSLELDSVQQMAMVGLARIAYIKETLKLQKNG